MRWSCWSWPVRTHGSTGTMQGICICSPICSSTPAKRAGERCGSRCAESTMTTWSARWRMPSGWTRPMPSSTAPRPVWWPSGAATPRRTALSTRAVATESSARKDYALRLLDYRHCETVILLQEQREYFQGEMEKLRRSVPSLPKPKTFVPGRGPKAYEGAEPYCFVSYAHINSDRVYPIVEQLMQRGIRLWYDDGIEAGSDFREFIAEKIRDSWQVLLFASTSPSSRALSAMRSTTLCTAASPSCG